MTEAVARCIQGEADPEMNVIPVAVAVGSEGTTEVFFPRR